MKRPTTYFMGDKVRYTGNEKDLYGGHFYEVVILEGHCKGQIRLIAEAPNT